MREASRIVVRPRPALSSEDARDARVRAWIFIFDGYRKKAAEQGNGKTKHQSLNTEEGGPRDLEEDICAAQKV